MKKPRREDYQTEGVYLHNLAAYWSERAEMWSRVSMVCWSIAGVAWLVFFILFGLRVTGVVG